MFQRFEKLFQKIEKIGFKVANKAHIYTVNAILLSVTYFTYTIFRDYNNFFYEARVRFQP